MVLLAALSGCVSSEPGAGGGGQYMSHAFDHGSAGGMSGVPYGKASVPGFQGPYGQPVAMAAPYSVTPVGGADLARSMVRQSVPLELVQQTGFAPDGNSGVVPAQVLRPRRQLSAESDTARPAGNARNAWDAEHWRRGQSVRARTRRARRRRRRRRLDGRRQFPVSRAANRSSFHRPERDAHRLVRPDGGR